MGRCLFYISEQDVVKRGGRGEGNPKRKYRAPTDAADAPLQICRLKKEGDAGAADWLAEATLVTSSDPRRSIGKETTLTTPIRRRHFDARVVLPTFLFFFHPCNI